MTALTLVVLCVVLLLLLFFWLLFFLREKDNRQDDVAIREINWYNIANDLILDQLSTRIRQTSTTGAWRSLFCWLLVNPYGF